MNIRVICGRPVAYVIQDEFVELEAGECYSLRHGEADTQAQRQAQAPATDRQAAVVHPLVLLRGGLYERDRGGQASGL